MSSAVKHARVYHAARRLVRCELLHRKLRLAGDPFQFKVLSSLEAKRHEFFMLVCPGRTKKFLKEAKLWNVKNTRATRRSDLPEAAACAAHAFGKRN